MSLEGIPTGIQNQINRPESNHLKEGAKPIIVSVGRWEGEVDGQQERTAEEQQYIIDNFINSRDALNLDWGAPSIELARRNLVNAGSQTYVISPVDNRRKFSNEFSACVSLVVCGRTKPTIEKPNGENISFMTHQMPSIFSFDDIAHQFKDDLGKKIKEIKDSCEPGTIDAVIVGGNYDEDDSRGVGRTKDDVNKYIKSLQILGSEVKNSLGFEPVVVNGPSSRPKKDNVYFDNNTRHMTLIRQEYNHNIGSFAPSQTHKIE